MIIYTLFVTNTFLYMSAFITFIQAINLQRRVVLMIICFQLFRSNALTEFHRKMNNCISCSSEIHLSIYLNVRISLRIQLPNFIKFMVTCIDLPLHLFTLYNCVNLLLLIFFIKFHHRQRSL